MARAPTTTENAGERVAVLWPWGNAFALEGGVLPVDFSRTIAAVAAAGVERRPIPDHALADLDRFVREMALKEERPAALGTWRVVEREPLVAASWVTIEQAYTVGSMPLETGAVLLAGQQIMSDAGRLQNQDPTADHYLSIRSSAAGARWEPIEIPLAGIHGAFRGGAEPMPAFRLAAGSLATGETVTLTYGDRSGGSRGFRLQTLAIEGLLLPVYIDLNGSGEFLTSRWPGLTVIGRPVPRSVRAFAPSVVAPGEPFELSVRSEDAYRNRPSGRMPAYEVLLDGEPWRTLPAGSPALHVIGDVTLDEVGMHRFTIRSADGSVEGGSNPVWVERDPGLRLYWGETHGHCGFAEGQGEADAYFRFGRDDARLDFLTLSEHDAWLDDWEWQRLQELTRRYHEEGRFITYLGYEWSAHRRLGGHHNVLFRAPERQRVGLQTAPSLPQLYAGLAAENDPHDVLVIPHAHNAGDWTRNDARLERLVEITSGHGTFEWFGNLYLESGFEVGFVGATDDHRTKPGYGLPMRAPVHSQRAGIAGLWAPAKTSDAIFDALRSLSAYATSGERILLEAHLNGHPMGTRQADTAKRQLTCRVSGTNPIDRIEVVKNGDVVYGQRYLSAPLRSRSWLQVVFESSSEVFFPPRDNPRAFRIWDGTIEVEGALVAAVETPGLDNYYVESASQDPDDPSRLRFHAETRGLANTILLLLEGATSSTALRFHLEPSMEQGARGTVRPPAAIPGVDFVLPFTELAESRLEHTFQVGEHTDRIVLQVIDPAAALDRELELTDLEGNAPGDYYYVRVTQLDGGMAFSSPFWVGDKADADPSVTETARTPVGPAVNRSSR